MHRHNELVGGTSVNYHALVDLNASMIVVRQYYRQQELSKQDGPIVSIRVRLLSSELVCGSKLLACVCVGGWLRPIASTYDHPWMYASRRPRGGLKLHTAGMTAIITGPFRAI